MVLLLYLFRGGNGLDWFSRLRCASLEDTTSPSTTSPRETGQEGVHHSTKDSVSSARERGIECKNFD